MHKFSTATTKSSALPMLRSVGLLNVPYSTFAGASVARLVRSALSSPRDKNLCIIRARVSPSKRVNSSIIGYSAPDIQMDKPRRLPLILLRVWVSTGFIIPSSFLVPLEDLPHRKFHAATEFPRLGQLSGKLDISAEQGILPPR